ncbi:L-asparaginase [Monaibacterium marinum]|uniref:L-asparaginase n=1 Tax=Pontivivens marinum TaxID=1690039 RepID=A0A2C9CM59_9RHOB|nr:asparaginase [Monaibacterium marinum]SOH92270.1 L-asparaginase [Monaibacterium marinum]
MRPVCVLYTGGTIGMIPGASGLAPDLEFEATFRAAVPEFDFEWVQIPEPYDSSVMTQRDWVAIADLIRGRDCGVVVLHGTDTMAYTAAALSFLLGDLHAPVVLSGSQIPMQSADSDAVANVRLALQVARESPRAEVMIAFGGKVLRGNRADKRHAQDFDAFVSPNLPPLDWRVADLQAVPRVGTQVEPVGLIKLHPGIGGAIVDSFADLSGLVIEAFGSGNVPGEGTSFHAALSRARARGQEIVVVTQCGAGRLAAGAYQAGQAVTALGLISGGDMVTPAAVAKLGWLLAQGLRGPDLAAQMAAPFAGECSA